MPQLGTLLALKELFKTRRRVTTGPVVLTPADIGTTIMVDVAGGAVVTLPRISGDGVAGVSALGEGAAICIISLQAPVSIDVPGPMPDTFNVGQAFPDGPLTVNQWCIYVSDGGAAQPSDWLRLCSSTIPD